MLLKASFGFGENVCWTFVRRAICEQSTRPPGPGSLPLRTRWVTRQDVKVDRVACPWLIRRFIDPQAEFLFVPENQLLDTASRTRAIPFDATRFPEVKLNHRGVRCTFEAILEDYRLSDPALDRVALIVRGADVKGQEHVCPESAGLRAIAHGFALSGMSDEERLVQEFPLYDALYEYCRR
jgi:hypothetical protein